MVYSNQIKCQALYSSGKKRGTRCTNGAYYKKDAKYLCGVHSRGGNRIVLPVDPNKDAKIKAANAARKSRVLEVMVLNQQKNQQGYVACTKLRMRKAVRHLDGYLSVFPNFKHDGRKDGYGASSLSPMSLGPVDHRQPETPIAANIENFFQGSKCYETEMTNGNPGPSFYINRNNMFEDPIPHRHKLVLSDDTHLPSGTVLKDVSSPKFFVWRRQSGEYVKLNYIQSRQFYCTYYERLAVQTYKFKDLKYKLSRGININIVGYDSRDLLEVAGTTYAEKLLNCYLDKTKPFGHELVLASLLVLEPKQYPWILCKTELF